MRSLLVLLVGLILLCTSVSAQAIQASTPFTITEGSVHVFDAAQCKDPNSPLMLSFGTCFGNNPTTPYVMPYFPSAPQEYLDPAYSDVFMHHENSPARATFRLGLHEAMVTLIDMPPEAAYFGFQTYLFTRPQNKYSFFSRFPQLLSHIQNLGLVFSPRTSPNPERFELFASIGNALNHLRLQTLNHNQPVWQRQVAFVTSASPEVETQVSTYLRQTYGPALVIAHEKIDRDHHVGLNADADDFMTLIRYALPVDSTQGETWRNQAAKHIKTFRFTLKHTPTSLQGFSAQHYETKTGNNEHPLNGTVTKLSQLLQTHLKQAYPNRTVSTRRFIPSMVSTETLQHLAGLPTPKREHAMQGAFLQGDFCRQYAFSCLGDSQDTDAYRYLPLNAFPLNTDSFFVGVNHTQTGNASYVSLSFYDRGIFMGLDSNTALPSAYALVTQLQLLNHFNPREQAELKRLNATAIGGPGCAARYGGLCWEIKEQPAANRSYSLIQRAYLRPENQTGADPLLLVTPRWIAVE